VPASELDHHPVVNVTWFEAETFCRWLAQRNPGAKLPSEAAWEHAATKGVRRRYPWGSEEPTEALTNFGMKVGHTTRVGAFPAGMGPFGTLDQAGNVEEWCFDQIGDARTQDAVDRAVRGGSWLVDPRFVAAAFRNRYEAWVRDWYVGFRCAG
jgi:formylglycine-generating enzyme required for sulfatase activity